MDTSPAPPDLPWPSGKISLPDLLPLPLHRMSPKIRFDSLPLEAPAPGFPVFWDVRGPGWSLPSPTKTCLGLAVGQVQQSLGLTESCGEGAAVQEREHNKEY